MSNGLLSQIGGKPDVFTLVFKTVSPKVKKPLFCLNCGGKLQFTYKQVILIIQGVAAPTEVLEEIMCRQCKAIYEIC